jgi:hypothetical protein
MNGRTMIVLAVLLALCGFVFAQPMLQISDYTTIPSDIYPDTHGYVQLTLTNVGDQTAGSVSLHYTYTKEGESIDSVGNIAAGSSAKVLVPFQITQQGGTIQVMKINAYYVVTSSGPSSSGASSMLSSVSVPFVIKQFSPLEVQTVSLSSASITPGEAAVVNLAVTNTGGLMNNLIITLPENSTFTLQGKSRVNVGNVPSNSSVAVPVPLVSSSSTAIGTYSIPLLFTYQDASNQPVSETVMAGPVSVLDSSTRYRVTMAPLSAVEIGSEVPFNLTLNNTGATPISGLVEINSTSVFTPLGTQDVYFDSVPAGSSVSKTVYLGVSSSASSGFYMLPLTLTTNLGNPTHINAGIEVTATPEITVNLDSSTGTPEVQVSNTGNSQIRSVYVSVRPEGSNTATENFVGTLNVDDFATVSLASANIGRNVVVTIRFRDSDNQEQSVTKTLTPTGVNTSFVQQGTRQFGTGNSFNATQRQNNPLGFLLGPAGRNGTSTGPDLMTLVIAGIVVIAIGGYAVYAFVIKKKPKMPKDAQIPPKAPR